MSRKRRAQPTVKADGLNANPCLKWTLLTASKRQESYTVATASLLNLVTL